jgi:2'-5' RNA ligase
MNQASIRSFFAIEISQENLSRIDKLLDKLKASSPKPVKWVRSQNMHLTLKFIGEFDPNDLENARSGLEKALKTLHPFRIGIKKMGAFPSIARPKVIWLGINADDALPRLVKAVNAVTEELGYPSERRPFSAHITLGRVKSYASLDELKMIGGLVNTNKVIEIGAQKVDKLHFLRSQLTPKGPVYSELFNIPLS